MMKDFAVCITWIMCIFGIFEIALVINNIDCNLDKYNLDFDPHHSFIGFAALSFVLALFWGIYSCSDYHLKFFVTLTVVTVIFSIFVILFSVIFLIETLRDIPEQSQLTEFNCTIEGSVQGIHGISFFIIFLASALFF